MTAVQLSWCRLRHPSPLAPQTITDAALYAAGIDEATSGVRRAAAALAHLGFGMTAGAAYGSLRGCRRRGRAADAALGAAFGVMVWASSYWTWIPALRLLPLPVDDDVDRQARLVAGHVVFGATLALTYRDGD